MRINNNQPAFSACINKTPHALEKERNLSGTGKEALESLYEKVIPDERPVRLDLYTKERGDTDIFRVSVVNKQNSCAAIDVNDKTKKAELLQWYEEAVNFLTKTFG